MYRSCLFCIFLVFIAIARADVNSTNEYRNGYLYMDGAGGWLKLHHMPTTFIEAFLRCKLDGQSLEEAGYSTWHDGRPNNLKDDVGVGQYCGGMMKDGGLDDVWCDSNAYAFICEMTLGSP